MKKSPGSRADTKDVNATGTAKQQASQSHPSASALPEDAAVAQSASSIARGIQSLLTCARLQEFEK